jgi:hypothetical protein
MYFTAIVAALLLFIGTEKTFIHFSRTARRFFWYLIACMAGLWLVRWLQTLEGLSMIWVIVSAVRNNGTQTLPESRERGDSTSFCGFLPPWSPLAGAGCICGGG